MKKYMLLLLAVTFTLLPALAFAQEAGFTINVKESVLGLIALLGAALYAAVKALRAIFVGPGKKIPLDDSTAAYIEAAIQGAIRIAEQKALAAAKNIDDPEVKSEILADAANFVLKQIPKLAAHFGVTNENVGDLITQRLGKQGVTNGSVQNS